MIVELYNERATIKDMEAKSANKVVEDALNLALQNDSPPQNGPFFVLSEFFGDDIKLIEPDDVNEKIQH